MTTAHTSQSTSCPSCGAPASGKFCSACGATLGRHSCAVCNAELSPQARFCPRCGQPAGGAARPSSDRAAWLAAGALCLVLVGAIVYKVTAGNHQAATPD